MLSVREVLYDNDDWYLVHCQSRKETYVANFLKVHLGLNVYLPECSTAYRGETRKAPFFPGYLFVQFDVRTVAVSTINTSPGVIRLIDFGGDLHPISSRVISEIAERLAQFERLGLQPFRPGDVVRVKEEGPMQGLEMIFVGSITPGKRVSILLNFLGRLKEVEVDIALLEKVPGQVNRQLPPCRYTRGKGRKIKHMFQSPFQSPTGFRSGSDER